MSALLLGLEEIDRKMLALAGGKGAHLGELTRIAGVRVPPGFCITTSAFKQMMGAAALDDRLERLSRTGAGEVDAIRALSAELRQAIEAVPIAPELAAAIRRRLDEQTAYAVRSSATAEDLPGASFAGQQDTFLNLTGATEVLQHISRCWASLFTERAVIYRQRNGIDHRNIQMAVLVQQMVFPRVSGVLFTADPVTGNRKVASIDACFGLGEALVSGRVNPDVYQVRGDQLIARRLQGDATLTDGEAVRLVQLGRRVEAHFGSPQDIEWCLVGDDFHLVQSRPITTLFPVPRRDDPANHVYLSVGHQQMMTEAIAPLGISFWQLTAARPMFEAGGRLFVDVTAQLATPRGRAALNEMAGRSDPLVKDALQTIVDRGDFVPSLPDAAPAGPPPGPAPAPIENDPAIVAGLIRRNQESLAALKREIETRSGPAVFDFILEDLQELKRLLFDPQSFRALMAGIEASWWLNDHLLQWLGEKNAADVLTQSAPNNVTSQMGLALLDVADVIRPHPEVIAFLERTRDDRFLGALPKLAGGTEARDAIQRYLDTYGLRCLGEIDLTRPRWSEQPSALLPMLLGNVRHFQPGEAKRRFEQGRDEAAKRELELLERLRALPDGEQKAAQTKQMIDRVRTFIGYREYPKYGWMSRFFVYKQALLKEAARLFDDPHDAFFLTFQELHQAAIAGKADRELIRQRKEIFRTHQTLKPPRVLTSDGEAISGSYRRGDLPPGALAGLAVSAGVVEGRARVVLDVAHAAFEPGDVLVTTFTDPSWTPAFVAIRGLVTEIGGQMSHGAVIAREYGLPAVVGVERATALIRDRQRIRVDGTNGFVELLG